MLKVLEIKNLGVRWKIRDSSWTCPENKELGIDPGPNANLLGSFAVLHLGLQNDGEEFGVSSYLHSIPLVHPCQRIWGKIILLVDGFC